MKKFFELFGLVIVILFSFYYTEKAALLVQSKSPIMQSIKEAAKSEDVKSVNAEIIDNKIIPGINGLEIDSEKSFLNMKDFGVFNEYYLVHKQIKPEVSLEDNKEKIIVNGNKTKKQIALIVDQNDQIATYLNQNNIKFTTVVYQENIEKSNCEQINGESEKSKFKDVEHYLNTNKNNVNICLLNGQNKEICTKENKYLVEASDVLTASNLIVVKNNIYNGSIILIKDSAKVEDVNLLIKHIDFKGLEIVYLSNLISEKNA